MKIAIATEDRLHIARRTGRAAEFALFEIVDKKLIHTEYIKNTHTHHEHKHDEHEHHGHEHRHSHKDIIDSLNNVDLFLVTHLGPHFKIEIEEAGIPFEIVKDDLIENLLKPYIN